jgi:hypothetical protein
VMGRIRVVQSSKPRPLRIVGSSVSGRGKGGLLLLFLGASEVKIA